MKHISVMDVSSRKDTKSYKDRFRTPLKIRNGVVYDPKMKADRLSWKVISDGRINIYPDGEGSIRSYGGMIDLSKILQTAGNREPSIYHHDIFGIIIEFPGRG